MTVEAPPWTSTNANRPGVDLAASYGLTADAFLSLGSMEGIYDPVVSTPAVGVKPEERAIVWPGFVLASLVAGAAYAIHYLPFAPFGVMGQSSVRHPISPAIIAILIGLLIRNTVTLPAATKAGCKSAVKKLIPFAIVLTGAGLSLGALSSIGFPAFVITIVCIAVALSSGYYLGRALGLSPKTAILLGAGTGICGNSAIIAVAPLIEAEDDDVALSVGAVNLFGLLAMLVWPVVGAWLTLSDEQFGVWAGTSIHAVPQVVTAGFAHSAEAGALATLVKLVRVAFLAPMVFLLALAYAKHHQNGDETGGKLTVRYARIVPWFVWGFVALAFMNSAGFIPTLHFQVSDFFTGASFPLEVDLTHTLSKAGKILLTVAMAAIGLEVNVRQLASVGGKAVTAGFITTIILGAVSLLLIMLLI